uniref:Uncharacterized protein n=1 Tax=Anguilla anguilla TaxID=7936 RepID=A0A0E9SJ62_ANGAN
MHSEFLSAKNQPHHRDSSFWMPHSVETSDKLINQDA